MVSPAHILSYKGFSVIYSDHTYCIQLFPSNKYISFQDCKNEIDRLDNTINKSFVIFPTERFTEENDNREEVDIL